MTIRHYPVIQAVNYDHLKQELETAYGGTFATGNDNGIYVESPDNITLEQVQTIVNVHNSATLTTAQQEAAQATSAKSNLQALMTGLHGLSAEDKSYAIACRIMAAKDGANQQIIMGIVDRTTATAYITSKPEWTGATAATKALVGDVMEMIAGITEMMLVVLTG